MLTKSRSKALEASSQAPPPKRRGRKARNSPAITSNIDNNPPIDPALGNGLEPDLASQQLAQEALAKVNLSKGDSDSGRTAPDLTILYSTADGILKTINREKESDSSATSPSIEARLTERLQNEDSRLNQRLNSLFGIIQSEKSAFVKNDDEEQYLDASSIKPEITLDADNGLIEAIVQKINLAILAVDIQRFFGPKDGKIPVTFIREIDVNFPNQFVSSFVRNGSIASSKLFEQTFAIALDLRTLVAVTSLLDNNEDDEFRSFFFQDIPDQNTLPKLTLFQNEARDILNNHQSKIEAVKQHITEVEKVFGANFKKKIGVKAKKYQWPAFAVKALLWVLDRNDELSHNLQQHGFRGDIGDIETLLSGGIPGTQQSKTFSHPKQPTTRFQPPPNPAHQRSLFDTQPNATTYQFSYDPHNNTPTQSRNDEQRDYADLLDPVAKANQAQRSGSVGPKRKRGSEEIEYDPTLSQDKGFAADNSPMPSQNQTQSPHSIVKTPKKKGRPPVKIAEPMNLTPAEVETHKDYSLTIGSAYAKYQNESKGKSKLKLSLQGELKARKRWTELETGVLIHLIDQFGISWAQIKKFDESNGNILVDRDQVNLKDKARNIKFDLLKGGNALPNNFEHVTLSTSMKAKLNSLHEEDANMTSTNGQHMLQGHDSSGRLFQHQQQQSQSQGPDPYNGAFHAVPQRPRQVPTLSEGEGEGDADDDDQAFEPIEPGQHEQNE